MKILQRLSKVYLLVLTVACNTEIETFENGYTIRHFSKRDFEIHQSINGTKYLENDILNPEGIHVLKNHLLINEFSGDTLIHVEDKSTMKCIEHKGVYGQGPNEIFTPSWMYDDVHNPNSFWAFQVNGPKIFSHFNIIESSPYPDQQFQLRDSIYYMMHFTFSSDSTILGTLADGDHKFHEFNLNGNPITASGSWTQMVDMDWPKNVISSLYSGKVSSDDSFRYFVLGSVKIDHLEVYDKKLDKYYGLKGPLDFFPNVTVDYSAGYPMLMSLGYDNPYGYASVSVGERYIYGLFSGYSRREVDMVKEKGWDKLLIFELDGTPYKYIELDRSLRDMTIDDESGIMYGLTMDANPNVVVYEL